MAPVSEAVASAVALPYGSHSALPTTSARSTTRKPSSHVTPLGSCTASLATRSVEV